MSRRFVPLVVVVLAVAGFGAATANANTTTSQSWSSGGNRPSACTTSMTPVWKYYGYAYAVASTTCSGDVIQIRDVMGLYRNGIMVTQSAATSQSNSDLDEVVKECGGGGHTWRADVSVCAFSLINGGRCYYLSTPPLWLNTC
jgi:hypothetical protein